MIGFPRGAGLTTNATRLRPGLLRLDLTPRYRLPMRGRTCSSGCAVQGNLDPVLLRVGGEPMRHAVAELCQTLGGGPYIFNLGHGVLPDTPPEHVAELARLLNG